MRNLQEIDFQGALLARIEQPNQLQALKYLVATGVAGEQHALATELC